MSAPIDEAGLDALFRTARSRNAWAEESLPECTWRDLYELVKFGSTSANCSPARFVFVTTEAAKARLKPALSEGNYKALNAPCIVIIGHDLDFASHMPELFPHNPGAKDWFAAPAVRDGTAFRNGTLQGAYLMLAARAMGLDCGPMSGFDPAKVDAEFFAGTQVKANFLCALGHGTDEPFPRSPRLDFDEACTLA